MRQRGKNANFGQPAILCLWDAELLWMLVYLMWEHKERQRLADERRDPEWIDVGGEA